MTQRTVRDSARAIRSVLVLALAVVVLGACSPASSREPATPTGPSPSRTADGSPGPTPVPTPAESAGSSAEPSGEPTQTDTAWGRIWDAIPASFPLPEGAIPSEPIGREASSAEFAVGAAPTDLTVFYHSVLSAAGYDPVSVQSPLEDGSQVIDAAGAGGCKARVTITPLSGVTHVTILYAATCPFR
jgi:hypothetical protein